MNIILVPGLWLDGSTWGQVTEKLEAAGHSVTELTLPGLESKDADRSGITLDDHVAAVISAVDAHDEPSVLVGHSASATLVYAAADARPDRVARLVYIGGFPGASGEPFMAGMPEEGADVPFPGWAMFEGPDSADLDDEAKAGLLELFVPSPAAVLNGIVTLTDDRRYEIPATVICPEFSPSDLTVWMDGGDLPELEKAKHLELVDIDSGHWPQFTRPTELAALVDAEAKR